MPLAKPNLGTIAARMPLRAVRFCGRRGHDEAALCARVGVSLDALSAPEARVPYETARSIAEAALEVTGDEDFGLHLASDVTDVREYDAGVMLLMASATVGVALERMASHQRFWADGNRVRLRPVADGVSVTFALPGATGAYARHADECAMAELVLGIRTLADAAFRPRCVRFRHRAPKSTREHEAIFGCPLEFARPHTEAIVDTHALDTRMKHANEMFVAAFEEQVLRAMSRLPERARASSAVEAVVRATISTGGCTLHGTARALATSTRTLQRRLRTEGTSFERILEGVRSEMSAALAARGLSAHEVATLLGYANDTALHHARKRWRAKARRSAD